MNFPDQASLPLMVAILASTCFVLLEILVRWRRSADYILYQRSEACEYAPSPGRRGLMQRRYRWQFNAMGARLDSDEPINPDSIVLIGDSTIEGGAKVDQTDTVGFHLAELIDQTIHPVGAGGWSLPNEIAFLQTNPDFLTAGHIFFVINSHDLCAANTWKSIFEHPLIPPKVHLIYLFRRLLHIVLSNWRRSAGDGLDMPGRNDEVWRGSLQKFLATYLGNVTIMRFPDFDELKSHSQACWQLSDFRSSRVRVVDLAQWPSWDEHCYLDWLHPNERGRRELARAIGAEVSQQTGA